MPEPRIADALELLRSAEINLENLVSLAPYLEAHPILAVVRMQLTDGIAAVEGKPPRTWEAGS